MTVVDPDWLPERLPVVISHQPDDVLLIIRRGLTEDQIAEWVTRAGEPVTRGAVDATISRGQAAP
jgi:hypothetical protein